MKLFPKGKNRWGLLIIRWIFIPLIFFAIVYYIEEMPGEPYNGEFISLNAQEKELKQGLLKHMRILTDDIGERNVERYGELERAFDYIRSELEGFNYEVKTQTYTVRKKAVKNIEAQLTGHTLPQDIIVVGAHYDSVFGSPGANDNGSGTSALLEIARMLKDIKPFVTIRFVFFVNEEPPFFETPHMGSRVYAKELRQKGKNITVMFSIETIGYYLNTPNSQKYPSILKYFYPDTGNFLAFVGDFSSRKLVYDSIRDFRRHTKFPSVGIVAPKWLPGVDWSDHQAFWDEGYPAIMLTDTAPFRYPYYHTEEDTYDKINYDSFARVVMGISRIILFYGINKPRIEGNFGP